MATSYPVPPWLHPQDIAGQYVQGLHLGAQIGMQRNQLAQQASEAAMRAEIAEKQANRDALLEQTQLDIRRQYEQQTIDLRRRELDQSAQEIQLKTMAAAQKYAQFQNYQKLMSSPEMADIPLEQRAFTAALKTGYASPGELSALRPMQPEMVGLAQDKMQMQEKLKQMVIDSSERQKKITLASRQRADLEKQLQSGLVGTLGEQFADRLDDKKLTPVQRSLGQQYKDITQKIQKLDKIIEGETQDQPTSADQTTSEPKTVIQDGNKFQVFPDGRSVYIGPA